MSLLWFATALCQSCGLLLHYVTVVVLLPYCDCCGGLAYTLSLLWMSCLYTAIVMGVFIIHCHCCADLAIAL